MLEKEVDCQIKNLISYNETEYTIREFNLFVSKMEPNNSLLFLTLLNKME